MFSIGLLNLNNAFSKPIRSISPEHKIVPSGIENN
jgi:hypothetical protein